MSVNNRTVIKKPLPDSSSSRPISQASSKSGMSDIKQYQQNGMSFQDYMTMKVLPTDQQTQQQMQKQDSKQSQSSQQQQSNYQGSLASQKFFTPKELNALNLSKRPDSNKKIIKEELKKTNGPVKVSHQIGSSQNNQALAVYEMNDSFRSQQIDSEQQKKLEKLSRRPFSTKSSRQGSRPGTAQQQDQGFNEKENLQNKNLNNIPSHDNDSNQDMIIESDVYEEIQITDDDYIQRRNLMQQLDRRQAERDKLELEEIFNNLKSHIPNEKDIDTLSQYSMKEIKEDKQINIYKPSFKATMNKKQTQQQIDYVINEYPSPQITSAKALQKQQQQVDFYPQSLVALPTGDTQNRLSQIQQQLLDLQKFKDEIMGDLDEFMDEIETKSLVTIPEQFEEVVDIVVNEQRDKAEILVQDRMRNDGKFVEELYDETGKPMWMKFLKEDYLGEGNSGQNNGNTIKSQGQEMQKKLNELTDKEEKIRRELEKIRKLDAQLAQKTKIQRDMKNAVLLRKQEEDRKLEVSLYQQQNDQSFDQSKQSRTQSSKGFETSSKKQVPPRGQSKGKPPSQNNQQRSVKKNPSSQQSNQNEDDDTDTFLTKALFKGKRGSKQNSVKGSVKGNNDDDDSFDSDELNDVVYDYDQQVALMERADDFLNKPLLSLPPIPEEQKSIQNRMNQSTYSFNSNMTSGSKDFLSMNKDQAKSFNPYKKPMKCDQLDDESKNRLESLMKDIDDNLEEIKKEKEDFYSIDINKSTYTNKLNDGKGAYLYSQEDTDRIEKINNSLMRMTPMLPAPDNFDNKSELRSNYDHSKFLNDDLQSMRSQPMSVITRKSGLTMLTHNTFQTGVQSMPGEHSLKKQAEKRLLDIQLKKIDQNLKRINETDDLSYATQQQQQQDQKNSNNINEMLNQLQQQKRLIDQDTLMRLIEECQEEEERQSIMSEMNMDDSRSVAISGYNEKTQMQLAQIEKQTQLFNEADSAFKALANVKEEYYKALDTVQERQNAILQIESSVDRLYKKSEGTEKIIQSKSELKNQLRLQEDEMLSIINRLESKEEQIKNLKDKEDRDYEMFNQQFSQQITLNKDLYNKLDEDDDNLDKIMQDIQGYQKLEQELELEAQQERLKNQKLLEELERAQVDRNDDDNVLLKFAKQQLDIIQERDEEEQKSYNQDEMQ